MENFYYACLYDILQRPMQHAERRTALNHLKAKIVKLHNARLARGQIELRTQDILQAELMSLFQVIKRRQRRGQREISEVQDRDQGWKTSARDILRVFSEHMRSKYRPIQVDEDSVRTMLETGYGFVPDGWKETLEMPITAEDLKAVVFKGDSKKSPGRDGIGLEFFKVIWEDIAGDMRTLFNQMLRGRQISERQKQGVIVCIAKNARPHTPEDYRPITLLNRLQYIGETNSCPCAAHSAACPETRSSTRWPQYRMLLPTRRRLGAHYL